MSDFIAHVIAELDTSKAQQQMNAFTNGKHKIDIDVNLVSKNGNINNFLNQIKSQFGQAGSVAGNNFTDSINSSLGNINVKNAASQIANLQRTLKSMNFSSSSIDTITKDLQEMELAVTKVTTRMNGQNLNVRIDGIDQIGRAVSVVKEFDSVTGRMQRTSETISTSMKQVFSNIDVSKLNADITALDANFVKLKGSMNNESIVLAKLKSDLANIGNISGLDKQQAEFERITQEVNRLSIAYKEASAENRSLASSQQLLSKKNILGNQIEIWMNKNTKAAKVYRTELEQIQNDLKNVSNSSQLNAVSDSFKELKITSDAAGLSGKSVFARLKDNLTNLSPLFGMGTMINNAIRGLKDMYNNVVNIDTAMTELKKVTNESADTYSKFLDSASKRSVDIGTTISDYVNSTADFARLGFKLSEAQELSEVANIYNVVGDEIDGIGEASSSVISTLKAFGIEASNSMSIVDKFNEVGNNFAISSGGIGEALTRSASSMAAANNTLDETIALITAANTVVQDPASVGTAFKTISMRIRGATTELEEAGLETDGMAESTAKLREEIMALSGVDIMLDENTFKSTYRIMEELSTKWQDLTDIQQASITELIAGKRQGNVISSLMNNFDIAQDALRISMESEGSAMEEHEKWMDSIEAKTNQLKAAWEGLSQAFLNSDFIKSTITGLTGVVQVIDSLIETFGSLNVIIGSIGIAKAFKSITSTVKSLGGMSTIMGASFSKLDGIIQILSTAFPNVTKAVTATFTAFKSGSGILASLGAGFSALSGTMLPIIAIAAAVAGGIYLISKAYVSAEEANEQMRASFDSYKEAKTDLDNVNSELEETNARISELEGKGSLTIVEQAELDKLKEVNEQLLIQQDLENREANKKAREAAEDTIKAYNKNFKENINADRTKEREEYADSTGNNAALLTDEKDLSAQIAALTQFSELRKEALNEYNKAKKADDESQMDWWGDEVRRYDEMNEDIKDSIFEQVKSLQEYRDILSQLPEDELAKVDGGKELLNKIDDQIEYVYSTLDPAKWNEIQFGEIFKNEDFANAKENLTEIAKASNGLGITVDDVKEKYPELAQAIEDAGLSIDDFVNDINSSMETTGDVAEETADLYSQAASRISESVEEASATVSSLEAGISAAQNAISNQKNGKSISIVDFNSDELKDYQSALEYVNGTMQLNADKVKEIAQAKAEEQVAINNTNKALEQAKYMENARQIEEYRQKLRDKNFAEGESQQSIQASIDALLSENSAIAETCKQYDLLSVSLQEAVGAYQNWLNSQSASDYGDMANDAVSAIKQIRDTYDSNSDIFGNFGSKKFDAAVEFIIPDSVDSEDLSAIESYMADFKQYLTFDSNGNTDGLNIDKFLENAVNAGLMSYSEDDGFQVLGGKKMEDFAEGLNMSSGMVQAFFDELQLKGADFDWGDEAVKTIGDLAVEANEAAESLRQIEGNGDLKIKMDVSDLSTTEEQISALDATIAEMDGVKAKPDVDASSIENANAVIQYCLTQKQLLSQPDVMRVDVSQVEGEIGKAISLLQQFQQAQNELEIQSKVGADTSEAESKISSLTAEIQGLSPDIKAKLDIDSTSVDSIKTSIAGLSAETINVKANVDATAITGYNPESKDCDVIYNPKTDLLPTSFDAINRDVNYIPHTGSLPESFGTITRYVNYVKTGDVSVNGTAHVGGTARAGGDWGTAPGGKTLVGELGQEIVVDPHTGKWYTVGDNGAEFRDIPAGAIVFNHIQSKSLLENGYVSGRASALVSGTALVTGGYKPYKPTGSYTSTSNRNTASSHSSYRKPSSGGTSSRNYNSGSTKDDFEETFNWVEIALNRITEAIDRIKIKAESTFKSLSKRNSAAADEIAMITEEIDLQNSAYNKYMQQANSVGLSESWAKKVRDGSIEFSTITDKDLAEKIKDYQEFYERAIECRDAVAELHEEIAQLYADRFDNIASDFEHRIALIEHLSNSYNIGLDKLEAKGMMGSKVYYEYLKKAESENQKILKQELADLTEAYNQAMASGEIDEYSEQWYQMQESINDVKEKLDESTLSVIEFNNAIRDLEWEQFDFLQDRISSITNESDFLIDLMGKDDLFDDKGKLNDSGMATMGLHGQNYNVYMNQADQYAKEAEKINAQLAKDPYNTDLIERREELLGLQRESILNAEDEKQAIVDLVEEGINLELESLQKLIDSYTESLNSAKDLYEYQKKVKDQTSEIAKLQKQLAAYKNDTSEEARSTSQKIEVDLSKAMEELQETEYDQYITDQKKLLDQLYMDYETALNMRLDNVDALISETIDSINMNSSSIMETLERESANVGYSMSEALNMIWGNEGGANSIITKYGEGFLGQLTSVNASLKICADYVNSLIAKADAEAQQQAEATKPTTQAKPPSTPSKPSTPNKPTIPSKPGKTDKDYYGVALAIWNGNYGWGTGNTRVSRLKAKGFDANRVQSIVNQMGREGYVRSGAWIGRYHGIRNLSPYHYNKYAVGLKKAYKDEDAWVNELGTESIVSPTDNAIITHISKGSSVLDTEGTENIWDMASDPSAFIGKHVFSNGFIPDFETKQNVSNNNIEEVTFNLPNVMNYEDFMNRATRDSKFESMVQSMTVNRLRGKNKLEKYKYRW